MEPLFLSLFISLSLLGSAASGPSPDPVRAICGRLDYPDLCVSAINSVRKDNRGLIDKRTAIMYIMQAVVKESKALRAKVVALPEDVKNMASAADQWTRENDPGFSPLPLSDCLENINMAVDEMGIAMDKLKANDKSATFSLSQINDNISVCKNEETVVLKDAERLSRHMSNCLSLAN